MWCDIIHFSRIQYSKSDGKVGWINYYGISNMKSFMEEIQQWLNHRLRQLIWKRWKLPRTKYKMLRAYGINHDHAMMLANSQKGYW